MVELNYSKELVTKAKKFAFNLHRSDRCIVSNQTKIEHLEAVATRVKQLHKNENLLLILAYLHDALDYCEQITKPRLIKSLKNDFGEYIYKVLVEISDNFKLEDISTPLGNEAFIRRCIEIKSPEGISNEAAIIILAEKVCNLEAMYEEIKKKGKKNYWENLKLSHNLNKSDVKEFYELIYDTLSIRCYGDSRLRPMIDFYDDLIFRNFN